MYIAIDFDGTIVEHQYPRIGAPVPGAIEWIRRFRELGASLILWTVRANDGGGGNYLSEAIRYCQEQGLEFDHVNENPESQPQSRKVYADIYIDDAAMGCPLLQARGSSKRACVDWSQVGPAVEKLLLESRQRKSARTLMSGAFTYPGDN